MSQAQVKDPHGTVWTWDGETYRDNDGAPMPADVTGPFEVLDMAAYVAAHGWY